MPRLCLAFLLLLPSLAAADHVTVKGTVLEGTVKKISAKEVVMETVYGKGELKIKTEDVSAIDTDAPFHVYKADDGTQVGRLVGISPVAVTLAADDGAPVEVPFDEVQAAPRDPGPEAHWLDRRPVESPWWSGSFDLALSATESTQDATALAVGFGATRERGPSRLKLGASYLRSTTQDDSDQGEVNPTPPPNHIPGTEDDGEDITADELRGFLRQEYDLTKRIFGFGSFEAEHDGVESLSYRLIPKIGAGYKIVNTEDAYFAVDAGPAYVYERFYDDSLNNYLSLAFGAESKLELPWLDASWFTRVDYLPSITDWVDDYRLRGETGLLVPIVEQLSLKASVVDAYNSQPAEDTSANSLTTLLGLSLTY